MSNVYDYIKEGYIEHFDVDEWPVPEDLKFVDYRVIKYLDELRERFGSAIYPSQVPKGLVRRTGSTTSRHYIGDGSLGLAVDVFPSERSLDCWLEAIGMNVWTGIGVYLDTNRSRWQPGPMIHLDIDENRPKKTFWVRDGSYYVKDDNPSKFWKLIYQASKI
jgi:hypothetical protein